MALPSTGPISMSQVRSELGLSGSISLGQSQVRALAGRSSGSISMSHLRGKSDWAASFTGSPYITGASGSSLQSPFARIVVRSNGSITLDDSDRGTRTVGSINFSSGSSASNTQIRFVSSRSQNVTVNNLTSWVTVSSSDRTITVVPANVTPEGQAYIEGVLEIRQVGSSSVADTAEVSLTASMLIGI